MSSFVDFWPPDPPPKPLASNQSSTIVPILRELASNHQHQYLESCESIFSQFLNTGPLAMVVMAGARARGLNAVRGGVRTAAGRARSCRCGHLLGVVLSVCTVGVWGDELVRRRFINSR